MGQNDSEIFSRLREIGEGVARIDERTSRMDKDAREKHADHERRIRDLERVRDKQVGFFAAASSLGGFVGAALMWLAKHIFGRN